MKRLLSLTILFSLNFLSSCQLLEQESLKSQQQVIRIAREFGLFEQPPETSVVDDTITRTLAEGTSIAEANPEIVSTIEDAQRFGYEITRKIERKAPDFFSTLEDSYYEISDSFSNFFDRENFRSLGFRKVTSKTRIVNKVNTDISSNGKSHSGLTR